ncbi:tumor necrosis factor receptor superfamily member 5-like [Mustelus asterias]
MKQICLILLNLQIIACCGPAKYLNDGECCSMCPPGTRVFKHCTRNVDATCKCCTDGEYTEQPNSFEKCLSCKVCDHELGLQVQYACTYTDNTICGPREGYFCIDRYCHMGRKHKTCPPGEGVKEKGTQFEDTVCEGCPEGTYSNNDSSTHTCEKWTVCEEIKQKQVTLGTARTDTVCEEEKSRTVVIIAAVIVPVLLIIAGPVLLYLCKKKGKQSKSIDIKHRRAEMGQSPQPADQPLLEKTGCSREKTENSNKDQTAGSSVQIVTADAAYYSETSDSGMGGSKFTWN